MRVFDIYENYSFSRERRYLLLFQALCINTSTFAVFPEKKCEKYAINIKKSPFS